MSHSWFISGNSSVIFWLCPWTEEPGRLQSMGSLAKSRARLSDFTFTFHFHALLLLLLLLLLLRHFSSVWLCATPETAAHQAPLSLGFSRQEHWSGLPFPSPVHGSEKWKWRRSIVSNSSRPHGLMEHLKTITYFHTLRSRLAQSKAVNDRWTKLSA